MPFGAEITVDGGVRFNFWAPLHAHIRVQFADASLAMQPVASGWHTLTTDQATAGTQYRFALPDGSLVPDPASRFQPQDVHGPSEVIDPTRHDWRDQSWRGRPWHEVVAYELHVGTFTPQGSFRSTIAQLDHLVSLGVTAIELMPLADFPGRRNWGYDGVLFFAPDASYGRPDDLKCLIDAAHERALTVILDVVYNHFGPEGNYLSSYAPQFFNARHHTPWGAAVNFDADGSEVVREFVIHNALYWLEEYHIDGLRLDAVHAIKDDSRVHILQELAERVRTAGFARPIHLILENEHNEASRLARTITGFDAQWNDDVHHVLHVAASSECEGYYADYCGDTDRLGRALAQGFAFQGENMPYRGSPRGEPCAHLPPDAFIAFIQNHDQVGNRALGDRLGAIAPPPALRAITAIYLLLPQIPMLFMGEEWQSARPFQFFSDFGGELADAVRKGRRQEFSRFAAFASESARASIPDPQSIQTFLASKLDWQALEQPQHAAVFRAYQDLLAVRARHIVPLLPHLRSAGEYTLIGKGAVRACWTTDNALQLTLLANLSAAPVSGFPDDGGHLLWEEGQVQTKGTYPAWTVRWMLRQ